MPDVSAKGFRNLRPYEIDALRANMKGRKNFDNLSISKGVPVHSLKKMALGKHKSMLHEMNEKKFQLENTRDRIILRREPNNVLENYELESHRKEFLNIKALSSANARGSQGSPPRRLYRRLLLKIM